MSGRGDRGRGRASPRGRGGEPRGASPARGGTGGRGGAQTGRGGGNAPQAQRGSGFGSAPPRGRGGYGGGGAQAPPAIAAPPLKPAVEDERIKTMEQGVQRFKSEPKTAEHPLRPGFGTVGQPIKLRTNFFAIKFPKDMIIYEYKIDITPKTDIARMKGRIIDSLEKMPEFQKYKPHVAHDKSERMVCYRALPQPLEINVTFIEENETQPRDNAKKYLVKITETQQLDTNLLSNYVGGDPANKDTDIIPLVSALNLIIQTDAASKGVRSGKNRHFFSPAQRTLGGGLEAWRGYFASVRPVWKTFMVNINVCMTAFVEQKTMAQAIMDFQRGSTGAFPDLGKIFGKTNIRVKTKHLGYQKGVFEIAKQTANQYKFPCEELGGTVTVAEYFRKKYPNLPIQYPDLPLINIGNPKKPTMVPAEFCLILRGIPYKGRLNDRQTSDMLKVACQSPATNLNLIRGEGFSNLGITSGSPHETMKNFGITIDDQPAVIPARILPPPGISYAKGRANPRDGSWNILDVQFHRGGNMGHWAALVIREQRIPPLWQGPNDANMWQFMTAFADKCRKAGMTLSPQRPNVRPTALLKPYDGSRDPSRTEAVDEVRKQIRELANANPKPSFILVLLQNRDNYIYPAIKRIGDVEIGIHTVCMQLDKATNQGKQDQYFSNVALKVNTKLGGINHKLDEKDLRWLRDKKTMVVGADVTHPGPTSVNGTPSIAAVVASIDSDFVQFPVGMRLQASKQEMIEEFSAMMVERLLLYQKRMKALPERVILFRDGVSEGQFDQVLEKELPQLKDSFRKVYKDAKHPQVMICICGKRHHARFFPLNDSEATKNGNTKPGTVVDKGIGDVYRFDFYLQAHNGLQGTVKATHYTVVYDEIGFSADALQQGTHSASYSYARATKAVSLVPPAYYADLACERGRLYLNDFLNLGAEKATSVRSGKSDREAAAKLVFETCTKAWGEGIHPTVRDSMFYI